MLHTKYQSSTPSSFREEEFLSFLLCSYARTCDPRGGASFDQKGHYMNEFSRDPIGDATYQVPSSTLSSFREERF